MRKKIISILICFILITTILPILIKVSAQKITDNEYKWIIMFYFNGDNKLSDSMRTEIDIIKNVGSTEDIKFVILSDSDEIGDTKLYYIVEKTLEEQEWPIESNMDDPNTIIDFVQKIKNDYTAEYYCLIPYSNKGAGWQGICYDQNGDGTMITMPELFNALNILTNNGTDKIDVFFAQSCLCGNLEFRCQIHSFVDYTVGYADCGLSGDLPYEDILTELVNNPLMTPEEFTILIVDLFEPANLPWQKIIQSMGAAQSNQLDNLSTAIDELALFLIENIDEYKSNIQTAWEDTRKYGTSWNIDYFVDLQHFLELMTIDNQEFNNIKLNIISKIDSAIIAKAVVEDDHSAGFNFYFPGRKTDYNLALRYDNGILPSKYEETLFAIETNWDEFLKVFLCIEGNTPPEIPIITGESSGKQGTEYTYNFVSTDPENDEISYYIDWGDNTNSGWTRTLPSGEIYDSSHTWSGKGDYTIKAKAKDTYGAESDWKTLEISMPKNKAINIPLFLQRFFQCFPFLEKILKQYY